MRCYVSQANKLAIEVEIEPKDIGQKCLEKVCEHLQIYKESDYFGLKYDKHKGEELWLNLRNPMEPSQHSRLALRVKFWVPPHLILQESTRYQFYLHAKLNLIEKRLIASDWDTVAKLMALIAQADHGNHDARNQSIYQQTATITKLEPDDKPVDLLQRVVAQHKKLHDMKSSAAQYWLLQEIANLEGFGEEIFHCKPSTILGVGPHGITVYENDKDKQVIPFTAIKSASSKKQIFRLQYYGTTDNAVHPLQAKLSTASASSLYRAITEKHAFYSCETVRSDVTSQFIRDLKGTIVSIFNEDSSLGKKYVFDIQRTCREVYDNARRALYLDNKFVTPNIYDLQEDNDCKGENYKNSNEKYTKILDALTCHICMDASYAIDTVFQPCGHSIACSKCAARCDRCPLCRTDISQTISFVPEYKPILEEHSKTKETF